MYTNIINENNANINEILSSVQNLINQINSVFGEDEFISDMIALAIEGYEEAIVSYKEAVVRLSIMNTEEAYSEYEEAYHYVTEEIELSYRSLLSLQKESMC